MRLMAVGSGPRSESRPVSVQNERYGGHHNRDQSQKGTSPAGIELFEHLVGEQREYGSE